MKEKFITVGRFGAPHGVKGEIKVHSFCEPLESIFNYSPWYTCDKNAEHHPLNIDQQRGTGKQLIVHIQGIDDRDEVRRFTNQLIAVERSVLPTLTDNEYYLADLEGLEVYNQHQQLLGKVEKIIETGADPVLVIEGNQRTLIPLVMGHFITDVNLEKKSIFVDWEEE